MTKKIENFIDNVIDLSNEKLEEVIKVVKKYV